MKACIFLFLAGVALVFASAGGGANFQKVANQTIFNAAPITWFTGTTDAASSLFSVVSVSGAPQRFTVYPNARVYGVVTIAYTSSGCTFTSPAELYLYDVT